MLFSAKSKKKNQGMCIASDLVITKQ